MSVASSCSKAELSASMRCSCAPWVFGRNGGPRRAAWGPAYIKVHESEIADDYPEPAVYERADEEADELLLADEEAYHTAPEDLPRRLLSNFAVYNSEVRFNPM